MPVSFGLLSSASIAVLLRPSGLEGPHHNRGVKDVGSLTRKTALELAEYARSDNLLEASIGMAAINSLIDIDESKCIEKNAIKIILEKGTDKNVAIVGHFPWIPKLREKVKNLWVLEQRIREGDLPTKEADRILPQCAVVGITGTTCINHTLFENFWNYVKKPMSSSSVRPLPSPLFSSITVSMSSAEQRLSMKRK